MWEAASERISMRVRVERELGGACPSGMKEHWKVVWG